VLELLSKLFPAVSRLLIMTDGTAVPTAPGNLQPQLVKAGIPESSVRAVYVRQLGGVNIPILAAHDISKPLFVQAGEKMQSINKVKLRSMRAAIRDAHS